MHLLDILKGILFLTLFLSPLFATISNREEKDNQTNFHKTPEKDLFHQTHSLKLFFYCVPKPFFYSDLSEVSLSMSNGQQFRTNRWTQGWECPFVNFITRMPSNLCFKKEDLPLTGSIRFLSCYNKLKILGEHLLSTNPTPIPLGDYQDWKNTKPISFRLTKDFLLNQDDNQKFSSMCVKTLDPSSNEASFVFS